METACLARYVIENSKIEFSNWDYKKSLRYLYKVGGRDLLSSSGLSRVCPKYFGDREDLIAGGGVKSREDKSWQDSPRELHRSEKRRVVATVLEVAINVAISTHVYQFAGMFFLQRNGGPIGLRSTAS